MIKADIHMHCAFSTDSDIPMEEMILGAIDKGLDTICFTDHMDYEYPDEIPGVTQFIVDLGAYEKEYMRLKDKYADKIQVLFGIECGMLPHLGDRYAKMVASKPFDFVICSSHLISAPYYLKDIDFIKSNGHAPEGMIHGDPYEKVFWEGRSEKEIMTMYFETVAKNIAAFKDFDTYAHLDYAIRYAPNRNQNYSYAMYADVLDEALKAVIDAGKALEVNTAGFKYGLGQPNPQSDILTRYRELGGEMITIGADAHRPDHIAYDFKKAGELLTSLGFKYYTVFNKRKPLLRPL